MQGPDCNLTLLDEIIIGKMFIVQASWCILNTMASLETGMEKSYNSKRQRKKS